MLINFQIGRVKRCGGMCKTDFSHCVSGKNVIMILFVGAKIVCCPCACCYKKSKIMSHLHVNCCPV